jgi:hypothetical protein
MERVEVVVGRFREELAIEVLSLIQSSRSMRLRRALKHIGNRRATRC